MKIKALGHVVLYVTNVEKIADFYRDVLGFREIARQKRMAFFSTGRTHHELLLIEIGEAHQKSGKLETGLYHIGFKIGDTVKDLKNALLDLKKAGVTITGGADHNVTQGIYIKDPDGNEIELYVDISKEWKKNPKILLNPPKQLHLD